MDQRTQWVHAPGPQYAVRGMRRYASTLALWIASNASPLNRAFAIFSQRHEVFSNLRG
jgi:hypothetical protein